MQHIVLIKAQVQALSNLMKQEIQKVKKKTLLNDVVVITCLWTY